jgi:DNA-binding beta-propeller fold protein YncE
VTGTVRGDIDIGGQPGNVAYDPNTQHILVDVQSRDDLAVIDPNRRRVVDRHPLPGCDHDHGLQIDPPHQRAFVACDGNARLLELGLDTFAIRDTLQTGAEPDVLTLDTGRNRLYVLAGSGVATIVDTAQQPARLVARGFLAAKAHSGTVDPASSTSRSPA